VIHAKIVGELINNVTARPYGSSCFFSQEISGFGAWAWGAVCSLIFKRYEQLL
jgi:hypothetical protein